MTTITYNGILTLILFSSFKLGTRLRKNTKISSQVIRMTSSQVTHMTHMTSSHMTSSQVTHMTHMTSSHMKSSQVTHMTHDKFTSDTYDQTSVPFKGSYQLSRSLLGQKIVTGNSHMPFVHVRSLHKHGVLRYSTHDPARGSEKEK